MKRQQHQLLSVFSFSILSLMAMDLNAETLERVTYQRDELQRKLGLAELKIERLETEIAKLKKELSGADVITPSATTSSYSSSVMGQKVVTIASIQKTDTDSLLRDKSRMQAELDKIKKEMIDVRAQAKKMDSENDAAQKKQRDIAKGKYDKVTTYRSSYSGYKYSYRTKADMIDLPHKPGAITAMKSKARALETQSRNLTIRISKLNSQMKSAASNQRVIGTYEDGTQVNLVFKGTSAGLAGSVNEGDVYNVTGLERSMAGNRELIVRSMSKISSGYARPSASSESDETGAGKPRRGKKGKKKDYSIYE